MSYPWISTQFCFYWVYGAKDPSLVNLSSQPLEKQSNRQPHDYGNIIPNLSYSTLQDTKLSSQSVSTLGLSQNTMLRTLKHSKTFSMLSCFVSDMQEALLKDSVCNLQFEFQNQGACLVVMQLPQPPMIVCITTQLVNCLHNDPTRDTLSV